MPVMSTIDNKDKGPSVEYIENDIERLKSGKKEDENNPLSGLTAAELAEQVVAFCGRYEFDDKLDVFHKAAKVAQRPRDFESIEDLSEDDKYWLRRELTSKYYWTSAL